jgi:hypothetical protein
MLRMYEPSVMLLRNSVNEALHVILRFMRNTVLRFPWLLKRA